MSYELMFCHVRRKQCSLYSRRLAATFLESSRIFLTALTIRFETDTSQRQQLTVLITSWSLPNKQLAPVIHHLTTAECLLTVTAVVYTPALCLQRHHNNSSIISSNKSAQTIRHPSPTFTINTTIHFSAFHTSPNKED